MDLHNLTPQQKIQILENIDWDRMIRAKYGLCHAIYCSTRDLVLKNIIVIDGDIFTNIVVKASEIIDLFTFRNAQLFTLTHIMLAEYYWFSLDEQGYQERRAFKDWMISEYQKKQLS